METNNIAFIPGYIMVPSGYLEIQDGNLCPYPDTLC